MNCNTNHKVTLVEFGYPQAGEGVRQNNGTKHVLPTTSALQTINVKFSQLVHGHSRSFRNFDHYQHCIFLKKNVLYPDTYAMKTQVTYF